MSDLVRGQFGRQGLGSGLIRKPTVKLTSAERRAEIVNTMRINTSARSRWGYNEPGHHGTVCAKVNFLGGIFLIQVQDSCNSSLEQHTIL